VIAFFRSMSGRVFLVLLVGILTSASLTWWLAIGERQRTIGQFREARALEQAEQFIATLEAIPASGRPAFLATTRRFGLRLEMMQASEPEQQSSERRTNFSDALSERLGPGYRVISLPISADDCPVPRGRRIDPGAAPGRICEALQLSLRDGSRLRMTVLPPRHPAPPLRTDALIYLLMFLLSIGALAYVVARMTMRPLKQLAQAAEELGNDIDRPPLAQQGTSEIRQATAAFNAMQARIRQNIQQRTQMLAAITHDLQTPLTRLRLRLEKVGDPELRNKLIGDLSATQAMVREGLDLARSMDSMESKQPLDLDSLLDSVCSDAADAGQNVTLHGRCGLSVVARPTAVRRCLTNLIDNAVKYGQRAHVAVQRAYVGDQVCARIRIHDGGPGIPADQLRKVFEPFHRVETSRSRDTGGTGLGLTIARNIAEQHGGSITLANHPEGGLEVTMSLPGKIKSGHGQI
jgi:signal transduction histidine kinase